MHIPANRFIFAKLAANRFVVEGVFPINGGRHAPESFSRVVTSKAKAESLATRYSAQVLDDVIDYLTTRGTRLELAGAYLAARAARPSAAQLSFF